MSRKSTRLPRAPRLVTGSPASNGAALLKLDLGSGPNPKEGFEGVDSNAFGQKHVVDLTKPWPWADSSVDEVHSSHFLEHLTNFNERWERVRFFNELHRILKPGAKATLIVPHWCSNRWYGDPTHKEPFGEMSFYYLLREWRLGNPEKGVAANAPHSDVKWNPDGYSCDFDCTWGYSLHPTLLPRNQEYQSHALQFWKEAAQDLHATLVRRA